MRFIVVALAVLIATGAAVNAGQTPVFRAGTELVSISASVTRGNTPVSGLTAADFRLTDEGVAQTIDAVTVESLPLDVTLFMDTSHSTSGSLDEMRRNVGGMAALLGEDDRFRLITIGLTVAVPVPWQRGPLTSVPAVTSVPGISLVYDALALALMHRPESGRRHLIVAITDGEDCGSVVDGAALAELSARSEAVLHWLPVSNPGGVLEYGVPAWCTPRDGGDVDYVTRAARQSGGGVHRSLTGTGDQPLRVFRQLLREFRKSYVLQYSPEGVQPGGWHSVQVTVPARPAYAITFRTGYSAE